MIVAAERSREFRPPRRSGLGAAVLFLLVATLPAQAIDPLSSKRGFADVGASDGELQVTNSAWYYTWGPSKPAGVSDYDAEFLPMIWWGGQANQTNIDRILGYGDVEWVLGFNEPERADQANMTVDAAINAWRTLDAGFRDTDVKLVSPAPSDTGDGQAWLADFMGRANSEGLKVDGVAFHWYGASNPNNPIQSGQNFLNRVSSYHNQYGLPVFITEFAMHDWGGNYTDQEMRAANEAFLDYVLPRLESRDYVEKYAFYNWFSDARLFEGNPMTPTNVGRPYVGSIEPGESYDLNGKQMGDRVAYLSGGELTHSAGGRGNVNHLNALEGTSTISGEANWTLGAGDWARVQPQATLRKAGINRISLEASRLTNDGLIEVAQGELAVIGGTRISGAGSFTVEAGGTLTVGGSTPGVAGRIVQPIHVGGGIYRSVEGPEGLIAISNTIHGGGALDGSLIVEPGGVVSPGDASLHGTFAVSGDYEALAGSELWIDLDTPAASDRVAIAGELRAGGTLSVSWMSGTGSPTDGESFPILDFASVSGVFDNLDLPTLDPGLAWDLSGLYRDGDLAVTSTPGDYNDDGVVDAADYTFWRDRIGQGPGELANDPLGTEVGQDHLAVWRSNYGLGSADSMAIPEPATLGWLLLVLGFQPPRSSARSA